jgi:SNF2 family DNA or RNA helicase
MHSYDTGTTLTETVLDEPETLIATTILHAAWRQSDPPALVIWAEDGTGQRFSLPSSHVRTALSHCISGSHASRVHLAVPSIHGQPLSSFLPEMEETDQIDFATTEVTGVALSASEAVRCLIELESETVILSVDTNGSSPTPHSVDPNGHRPVTERIQHGGDLLFWRTAARFCLELMARERIVPVLGQNGDVAVGRWVPLLQASDRDRFIELVGAMPSACVATQMREVENEEQEWDEYAPNTVLFAFLAHAVDELARGWLVERYHGSRLPVASEGAAASIRSWMASLMAENPRPVANSDRIRPAVQQWLSPLFETPHALGFTTCLRLRPPKEGNDDWTLTLLLRSIDDPTEFVPAGQVWREKGQSWEKVKHKYRRPQEKLLYDLGLAARVFPPIARGLKNQHPEMVRLDVQEAYRFLREAAPALEESDIGVIAPTWWAKRRTGLTWRINVRPVVPGAEASDEGQARTVESPKGFDHPVQFKWQVLLGGGPLSPEGFNRMVRMKVPLIRMKNEWIELNPEEAERVQRFWAAQRGNGHATLLQALDLASQDEVMGLPIDSVEFEGWLGQFVSGDMRAKSVNPASLRGELRPYQKRGAGWMDFMVEHGFGAILADDMGLGKTVELIAMLLHQQEEARLAGPVLLICPMSVAGNWVHESRRFGPSIRVYLHHGPGRLAGQEFKQVAENHDLVISTYSLLARDLADLKLPNWYGVVLDEAQNVKNPDTQQAKAIRQISSGFRLALTGTPVENRLAELWVAMDYLNPDYLGSFRTFQQRFATPIERGGEVDVARQLRRLVQPFILRRVKTDPSVIADLPEKMEMKVYCSLSPAQAELYEATVNEMLRQIDRSDGMQRRGLVLATLTKLKQICNHPTLAEGQDLIADDSGKLLRLVEMLEEVVSEGDSALVFTQFVEFGKKLHKYLQQRFTTDILLLHGGTPRHLRERLIQRFQDPARGPAIFILSLKAGGLGLNLTRANHVFHYDRWWNPAVEEQATDRAFRIGQTRDVQVHKLITLGTLEEHIDEMLESKRSLANQIVGTGEGWLTELSTTELHEILTLRREMAGGVA